ncbi:hypothetical protein [Acetonema longum]|uniref:Uncharacterized protein n=1 Tax=Acetonema longum DSM 6540 TaxID=1009370 RepID=F7NIE0_9FIRM|nr:hypothetical protein [Acetonema longum]EGO64170.1 hypothetical protein ALO_09214 [Acetonema longum DSM 6540]
MENTREKVNQAGQKLNQAGHKLDAFVREKAEKHSFTNFQVWLGIAIALLAIVGVYHLL